MVGLKVPVYGGQTQFVGPYRAPTATAAQMGSAIGTGLATLGAGITDVGLAQMQRSAERQKMEDLNYEQAQNLADNKSMYDDFLANRQAAVSGAESFSETSATRWTKLREENRKKLLTEGGYRPSQAAIDRATRTSEDYAAKYEFQAMDYEDMARRKKAFDDSSKNIEQMQAAAAEYGQLDRASIEMEKALETAKLALPIEDYQNLEKNAREGMGKTVGAYLTRLQDRALKAGSDQERQSFETEADSHVDAAMARGYIDGASGAEMKRLWKENYQNRDFPTLDPTERQRIGLNMTTGGNIKEQLFQRESGGNYANDTNSNGYTGGYQFGAPLLTDLGLYTPGGTENLGNWSDTGKNAPGKWSGTFNIPGFPDVKTKGDFLRNPAAQEKAWEIHNAQMDQEIVNRGMEPFIGQTIDGIPITADGLKAAMHLGGATGVEKFLKTATSKAGAAVQAARRVPGKVIEAQAGTRNKPLNQSTRSVLDNASGQTGLTVRVTSGAQPSSGKDRVGGYRHNEDVGAADFELLDPRQNNKVLSMEVPEDRERILEFLRITKQGGFTGFGAGLDYMGPTTIHAGFGAPSTWGAGGKGANAPQWLVEGLMGTPQGGGLRSSTNPADNNGTTMTSYLRMGSNAPSYFDSMPQDQMVAHLNQANIDLSQVAAANARQWAETMAVRKGELSLAIATGQLASGDVILNDDTLEPADKAGLYKSYQEGQEAGATLRANQDAYSNGAFKVDPFNSKEATAGDNLYDSLIKGADEQSQKAIAAKFAGDTGYVPKSVMANLQNGRAASVATTVQTAMTDAERLLAIAPNSFEASDDGRSIRDSVAEWKALQNHRGQDPREAAQTMVKRRDIEFKTDDTTQKAAEDLVKQQSENMGPLTAAVGVTGDWGNDPTFGADQQLAFQDDALEIYREKLLTTAKMDPAIAQEQAVAELKTLWGRTPITGEERVMRHPPEAVYNPIGGSHDYIERSFNHFRSFEDIPEGATEVQLISTDITLQDKRNNDPARYMVGWFEERDGQRIWQMSPNWFYVGPEEQANAAANEVAIKEGRARTAKKPEEEIADIMALPADERAAELNRRRFGGNRQDYIDEARRIEALQRRPSLSLEARDEAAAARTTREAERRGKAEVLSEELGFETPNATVAGAEGEVPDTSPPAAEGVLPETPSIEERMNVGGAGETVSVEERMNVGAKASIEERMGAGVGPPSIEERMGAKSIEVSAGERAALVSGLGKKAAQRLLAGNNWERVVEGLIENAELGGSSDEAAARREAHDLQLEAIGVDPRSERRASPGNLAKLARGILDLKRRMQEAGVEDRLQDAIIAKVRQTSVEMMQRRR